MRTIGVRELKAGLSRALRDVQEGERYLVTDRGRVVAELRPPGSDDDRNLTHIDQVRLRMARAGELRLAEQARRPYKRVSGVKLPDGTAQALLDWTRGER